MNLVWHEIFSHDGHSWGMAPTWVGTPGHTPLLLVWVCATGGLAPILGTPKKRVQIQDTNPMLVLGPHQGKVYIVLYKGMCRTYRAFEVP